MEEQKYYTPAPEDIRVGFECEVQVDFDAWETATVTVEAKVFDLALLLIETNGIRVPYLTAEQIEAEGWGTNDIGHRWIKTANGFEYRLTQSGPTVQELEVNTPHCWMIQRTNPDTFIIPWFQVFRGTIRCVNDLRSISKLLGI